MPVERDSYGGLLNDAAQDLVGRLTPVIERLTRRLEWVVEQQAQTLRERSPSYQPGHNRVPDDALLPSAQRNVDKTVRTLRDGRSPRPEQVDEAWVARERTEQGLPAGEMLDAYRLAHRVVRDTFVQIAVAQSVEPGAVMQGACLLWDTADAGASQLYEVRREFEIAIARCDEEQRMRFLHDLLRSGLDPSSLGESATSYGLELGRPYLAVRARPRGTTSLERLQSRLEAGTRHHGQAALLGIVDGEVVGVVPRRPDLGGVAATVGISGPAHLMEAGQSFRNASRMLDVAAQFDDVGVFDLNDLGLRVAMAGEPELGTLLVRRYLAPVEAQGDFGAELIATLREYFAAGRQITRTARTLGIHSNSLRYRLHRFEEIVGVSLEDPKVLTELWWALECSARTG
ncbi:PucR family transcriptional regulator [Saccharopolyspora karakumensis]|uniref:PucR family transcriptional regulator n=1 Tax=Saccharopolyspora karakumensis TaxID=2530386 RepID=A0A4R5BCE2_9PSEU|nr:helix-turn-helix domain-containing protein [Saccharopolyspora karakumensis]TDD81434.1 PucR family transcriptional regulator [Saccharopolyspora karakumensis]